MTSAPPLSPPRSSPRPRWRRETKLPETLPLTKLPPAKVRPNLCFLTYRVSTALAGVPGVLRPGAGLLLLLRLDGGGPLVRDGRPHDPDCAMAWWGLSRALEEWSRATPTDALKKAQAAAAEGQRPRTAADHRPGCRRRAWWPGSPTDEERRKAAAKTHRRAARALRGRRGGWYARAQLAGDGRPAARRQRPAAVPFYKALLRINPLHPGANHELVHYLREHPAAGLGWPHAERYIESSPGIPHAFHMQAHLAMRLGRWDKTSDRSRAAIELEQAVPQATMNVKPQRGPPVQPPPGDADASR